MGRLSDVTLVTDDGQHIQAHKIILSLGSNFFADIFMKSNHSNMLVYLKGISSDKLELVIDFIYSEEVFITQEQLKVFIETGKEFQVKGLEGELMGIVENSAENPFYHKENDQKYNSYEDEITFTGTVDRNYDHVANIDERNLQLRTNDELSQQISEMIEKNEGVWIYKICGKTAYKNGDIRKHAERRTRNFSFLSYLQQKIYKQKKSS